MASIIVGKNGSRVSNFDSIGWDIEKDQLKTKSLKVNKGLPAELPGLHGIESVEKHLIIMQKSEQIRAVVKNKKAVPIHGAKVKNGKKRNEARFNEKYPKKSTEKISKDI